VKMALAPAVEAAAEPRDAELKAAELTAADLGLPLEVSETVKSRMSRRLSS
jgi:hypothetical protein